MIEVFVPARECARMLGGLTVHQLRQLVEIGTLPSPERFDPRGRGKRYWRRVDVLRARLKLRIDGSEGDNA